MRSLALCLLLLVSLVAAGTAQAEVIISYNNVDTQWDYSGDYMFTVKGNDGQILKNGGTSADGQQLLGYINEWIAANTDLGSNYIDALTPYDKYTAGSTSDKIDVSYGDTNQYGAWTSDAPIQFYVVKAGNSFAIYWLGENGATSGTWTDEHLDPVGKGGIPELSHFTGYNQQPVVPPVPTPEPSSLLLMGLGAAALGIIHRRRRLTQALPA